ncbi:ALDH-like protein [Pleurotus eryngii]|uniref:ALDH-like protein n=1 Tax=Pleurotus eryngii TaxID=5323 RepID=A0A9P5ZIB9_PLEER|nr:ALDH-like protein [Pleurotus eryngii]
MPPLTKLFINGEYRPSSSTFEVLDPFSHQVVGLCSTASSRDCHDAIEAANKAFASWENTTPWQRRDILLKAADLISTEKEDCQFTGSERVGRILAMEAAKFLKPCVLELGGKAPVVVLSDANIREAARSIVFGAMAHSGQVCMSAERVIVHQDVAEQLVGEVKRLCEGIKAGDPSNSSDPSVKLGALFSEVSALNVVSMMQEAVDGGARLVPGDLKHEGSVVQPHLLADVDVGMRLWKEESFGPVTVFMSVNTIDDAVEMANETTYSLSAALWTTNVHSAMAVAPHIRAGVTSVNGPTFHSEAYVGVVGLGGSSGYGRFDVENFTDKWLIISHPDWERPYPGLL